MLFCRLIVFVFFSSRRRHTRYWRDWSSDVCSSDLIEDLRFGIEELHPDWVATSFVRTGDEVHELKERIKEFGGNAPVISKIEKHEAIDNIEEIIWASDGIMVARGDLAVELSAERVPIEQKRMIARCRRLGRPVIVATQMLDRKSTRLNSSHANISYAVFCLKK